MDPQNRKAPGVATPGGPWDIPMGMDTKSMVHYAAMVKNYLQM